MSLALVHSRAQVGVQAPAVSVETHLANGLPHLTLVGLPETTVKESKDRVRSAIVNSGLNYPQRRITQNLAPADLPKDGGRYDLAIALGILAADAQVPVAALVDLECLGELALSGKLRPVQGLGGPKAMHSCWVLSNGDLLRESRSSLCSHALPSYSCK